jgi:hypothetical protein
VSGSSSPWRFKHLESRPPLGPTQALIQWIAEVHHTGVKRSGHETDQSCPIMPRSKNTILYVHSYISFHDLGLHWLSTGTIKLLHIL